MHLKNQLHEASKSFMLQHHFSIVVHWHREAWLSYCSAFFLLPKKMLQMSLPVTMKPTASFATGGSRNCCTGEYILIHFHTLLCSRMVCGSESKLTPLCASSLWWRDMSDTWITPLMCLSSFNSFSTALEPYSPLRPSLFIWGHYTLAFLHLILH